MNRNDSIVPFQEPRDISIKIEMESLESENSSDLFTPFVNPDNKSQILEKQYMLRWLPTRRRRPKYSEQQMQEINIRETAKQRSWESNEKMRRHVLETMKSNYWTSLYLYGEVARIRRSRLILDEMTVMIKTLESPLHKDLKRRVLQCYREAKREKEKYSGFWDNKNTNHVVINVLKDNPNEGVI